MLKKLIVLLLACFQFAALHAQDNYLAYYSLVNKAEEVFVVSQQSTESLLLYEQAFSTVSKPYISDLFIAAQIAAYAGDTAYFFSCFTQCFNRGMPYKCLQSSKVFIPMLDENALGKKLQKLYANRLIVETDTEIRDSIYFHFYREQVLKHKMGRNEKLIQAFHQMERENTNYFKTFIAKGIFPSEQLMGILTDSGMAEFLAKYQLEPYEPPIPEHMTQGRLALTAIPEEYALCNNTAWVSFLHSPCAIAENKADLWKCVENGYLHPKEYCMMEEWFARSIGNPNYPHDCAETSEAFYYNILNELMVTSDKEINMVEANRAAKYVQKFAVDRLKRKLMQEKGFDFFFGFLGYR